jgi:hypothetical protein
MDEDGSDRCSIACQDFERTIVDHGALGVGNGLHTADCCDGTEHKHCVGTQERTLRGRAIHGDDIADADVVVIGFHHHVCGSRIHPELKNMGNPPSSNNALLRFPPVVQDGPTRSISLQLPCCQHGSTAEWLHAASLTGVKLRKQRE